MSEAFSHTPVLLGTVMEMLDAKAGETVLDVTAGLGGHSAAFLERIGQSGRLIVLDADDVNLSRAKERLSAISPNVTYHHCNFSEIEHLTLPPIDVLLADLGLSSPHVDDAKRGFSFRFDGPLDLRYDQSQGPTAADLIHSCDINDLARIFRDDGELFREAKWLAGKLAGKRFETTAEFRAAVEDIVGYRAPKLLPQIFQALRIAVNDELHALESLLSVGPALLAPGGRMGIISYHSLEDRLTKHAFRALTTPMKDPITGKIAIEAPFELLTAKAIVPREEEIKENPRSRSAKFRVLARRR